MLKRLASLLLISLVAACGGGGGGAGTSPFGSGSGATSGGTTSTGGTSVSAAPTVTVAISSPSITSTVSATVTITLKDGFGQPIAGKVVGITTTRGLGSFAAATVLTNSSGTATAALQAAPSNTAGADEVVANAVLGTTTIQGSVGFEVVVQTATVSAALSSTTVSASAPATFTATVRDTGGRPVAGQLVRFSAADANLVAFSAASAVTNSAGTASVVVSAASPATNAATQITAASTVNGKDLVGQAFVSLIGEIPSVKLSLSSSTITSTAPATVRALLKDSKGNAVSGSIVTFSTFLGLGVYDATTALTDSNGIASVVLSPKTATTSGADFVNASAAVNSVAAIDSTVAQFTSGSATGLPTLGLALSSTSVSSAIPVTVTATVLDAKGLPTPGKVVAFKSLRGLGALSVGTALTNAVGQAIVSLAPVNSTSGGADEVVATADVSGSALQSSQGFQLQATAVTITAFTSSIGSGVLSAYGQTSLAVTLTGASIGSPVNVSLSSSCAAQGKATVSPSTFTATAPTTTIQYKDNGCGVFQLGDKLQASIVASSATPQSLDIAIQSPSFSSIAYVGATPSLIYVKGSGYGETSIVRFQLRDAGGNPLPNQVITMSLATFTGGVTIEGGTTPVTQTTNSDGQVSVLVNAGTVPTPVRIVATTGGSVPVRTVSSGLSVAVGLPSQLNFSLSQSTQNIEGMNLDFTPNSYKVIASDRNGNPVPDGTSVNFVTEGGQVEAVKQTQAIAGTGVASVTANFVSANPRPADGRITITAYALGEESFLDLNGNNAYDPGEPFQDLGDIFKDRNFDGVYDGNVDEYISPNIIPGTSCYVIPGGSPAVWSTLLAIDARIPTVPNTCDGAWGKSYVRRAIETVLSTSASDPVWAITQSGVVGGGTISLRTDSTSATTVYSKVNGSTVSGPGSLNGRLLIVVRDANGVRLNPVAATSTVAVSATTGLTVTLDAGSPVPNTLDASTAVISYTFDATTTTGTVTLKVTSPNGLVSVVAFTLTK